MPNEFDVSVEGAPHSDGSPALRLKLSAPVLEVNVLFSPDEARDLRKVLALGDEARGLRLGTSAESHVHWAQGDDKEVYLLIGDDDETWDIGVTLPEATFLDIVKQVEECL